MKKIVIILFSALVLFSCNEAKVTETNQTMSVNDSLKISKFDLIMLASFSQDNKEVIKDKFPQLFKEAQNLTNLRQTGGFMWSIPLGFNTFVIERAQSGNFKNMGFRLNDNWEWQLERDEFKQLILVPYIK